ncbi:MAG: thiamine pyrophosphate-dependent enzyme [Caldilineaceae bacterium]
MCKIRAFEENANELYLSRKMPGLTHLYIGEEAVAVGVCEALRRDDYITSTHRGHGHCLAKGAQVDRMFAELLGAEAGLTPLARAVPCILPTADGQSGRQCDRYGSAGIATGAGLSIKMRQSDQVAVCFFGDGAMGQGLFLRVGQYGTTMEASVIYVCENNQYGEYTCTSEAAASHLYRVAQAFAFFR